MVILKENWAVAIFILCLIFTIVTIGQVWRANHRINQRENIQHNMYFHTG